jgi:hypothetical protein
MKAMKRPSGDQPSGIWKPADGSASSASSSPNPRKHSPSGLPLAANIKTIFFESGDHTAQSRKAGSGESRRAAFVLTSNSQRS